MLKDKEIIENKENREGPVYNTYEERRHINIASLLITLFELIVLCCVTFKIHQAVPVCFISLDDGKMMLAILLAIVLFYVLCFDMLAFCVETVSIAFLVISTYKFFFEPQSLLPGFFLIYACSILVMVAHFLYPYILKKVKEKKR